MPSRLVKQNFGCVWGCVSRDKWPVSQQTERRTLALTVGGIQSACLPSGRIKGGRKKSPYIWKAPVWVASGSFAIAKGHQIPASSDFECRFTLFTIQETFRPLFLDWNWSWIALISEASRFLDSVALDPKVHWHIDSHYRLSHLWSYMPVLHDIIFIYIYMYVCIYIFL